MSKRRCYVHVGLDDGSSDVVEVALDAHAHALLDLGVRSADSREHVWRAGLDLLGVASAHGLSTDEVAGEWERLVGKAAKGRDTVVVSHPLLAGAGESLARRVVTTLSSDHEVHVVVTLSPPSPWTPTEAAGHDLPGVLQRWSAALRHPGRLHVVIAEDPGSTWKAFGRVVGFGTASLPASRVPCPARPTLPAVALPDQVAETARTAARWREAIGAASYDVVGEVTLLERATPVDLPDKVVTAAAHALGDAHLELARLIRRQADLEARLAKAEKKRRKLKARLADST